MPLAIVLDVTLFIPGDKVFTNILRAHFIYWKIRTDVLDRASLTTYSFFI